MATGVLNVSSLLSHSVSYVKNYNQQYHVILLAILSPLHDVTLDEFKALEQDPTC